MSKLNMPAIIPVAGLTSEFSMEWDASLMPVSANYTALEAAVYECIHAGCSSIWIVANDDVAPLIRRRVGEYATDIRSVEQGTFKRFGGTIPKKVRTVRIKFRITKKSGSA